MSCPVPLVPALAFESSAVPTLPPALLVPAAVSLAYVDMVTLVDLQESDRQICAVAAILSTFPTDISSMFSYIRMYELPSSEVE